MSKQYETVFILTPVLSEEQAKETVKKFKKALNDLGAKLIAEEFWGLKKLAYPIDKKSTGFYQLFEYTTDSITLVNELEVTFKRDERVMRYMTVALDKHSIAWAERRRTKRKGGEVVTERKPKRVTKTASAN